MALKGKRDKVFLMTKVCIHGREGVLEMQMLEQSLQCLHPLGMKPINGGSDAVKVRVVSAEESLRYAMSLPVSTISGIDSVDVLVQNLSIACGFNPLGEEQMAPRNRCKTLAADGRLELFKTIKKHGADIGREQHHYPPPSVLPA